MILPVRAFALSLMMLPGSTCLAQQKISYEEALSVARHNNPGILAAKLGISEAEQWKRSASEIPKTNLQLTHGQYNSYVTSDNNFTISQTLPFPTVWSSQASLGKAQLLSSELNKKQVENEMCFRVASVFYQLLYLNAKGKLITRQDSIYGEFVRAATWRYEAGEGTLLEKLSAETQRNEVKNSLDQNQANTSILQSKLQSLLNSQQELEVQGNILPLLTFEGPSADNNPSLAHAQQEIEVIHQQKRVEAARFLPEIMIGYFNQTLIGYQNVDGQETYFDGSDRFQGFQVGVSLPLWFVPGQARVKAMNIQSERKTMEAQNLKILLEGELEGALQGHEKASKNLTYYQQHALPNAEELIRKSATAFRNGEIDYTTHLINTRNGLLLEEGYLSALNDYQQSVLVIQYLTGNFYSSEN